MDVGNIKLYTQRWEAVEEIQHKELRLTDPTQAWRQVNALRRRAILLDLDMTEDEEALDVIFRWAKLKSLFLSHDLNGS